jgi:Helix-turn-helix domain
MRTEAKKEARYRAMRERAQAVADGRGRPADQKLEIHVGEQVYTVAEVAQMLKIGVETARRKLRRRPGVLRWVPEGGTRALIRVPHSILEAMMREAAVPLPPDRGWR